MSPYERLRARLNLFLLCCTMILSANISSAAVVGDINQDGKIDLMESIYALQVASGVYSALPDSCLLAGKGSWTAGEIVYYNLCDVVEFEGITYACITSHTSDNSFEPGNTNYWTVLSIKGDTGDTGPEGPPGEDGAPGTSEWADDTGIVTTSSNVGIGTTNPIAKLDVAAGLINIYSPWIVDDPDWGYLVDGCNGNENTPYTCAADGVTKTCTDLANSSGGGGDTRYVICRQNQEAASFSGDVTVDGNILVSGTVDGRDIAADGGVLDSLSFGGGTDTTNDSWTGTGDVYTTSGNVSIGTSATSGHRLNVMADSAGNAAVRGVDYDSIFTSRITSSDGQLGVESPAGLPGLPTSIGVLGRKFNTGGSGVGVYGLNSNTEASNYAMYAVANGDANLGSNFGLYALAEGSHSFGFINYGVYAKSLGALNWAGYFDGNLKTTGRLESIGAATIGGTLTANSNVSVAGNIHATGDITADGIIHVDGDFTTDGTIHATDLTMAVQGVTTYTGSTLTPYGGYFTVNGPKGRAVYGSALASVGVNYGGYFESAGDQGRGVYGSAVATEGVNYGGYFESAGDQGRGIYGSSSGTTGYGGYFSATGDLGTGIYAEGTGMGGTSYAAVFKGNIKILSPNTGEPIMELGEGLDYAEGFDVSDEELITAGTVLVIDPETPGKLKMCDEDYDLKVAGVVAGAKGLGSGVRLGADQFDHDVALAGRVYCNVEAGSLGIKPGDQLTTSSTPGYAMKADDHGRSRGAILGKAMEPLAAGESGQILILVTLQ